MCSFDQIQLFRYHLPQIHTREIREGIVCELSNAEGMKSYGDIAPLPGWSKETFLQALHQLHELIPRLLKGELNLATLTAQDAYPSVLFGLLSAFYGLQQGKKTSNCFPVCAFLMGTASEMRKKAETVRQQGYRYAKIKIGHLSFDEALQLVKDLKDSFRLRLDLNRAWSLDRSRAFFSHFSPHEIEYVEEPVDRTEDLAQFDFPFALDETQREMTPEACTGLPYLKAFIFKPSLQGGDQECRRLMETGKQVIFSPAFESGVGISQIARLAKRMGLLEQPLGLDTYRYLKSDILQVPLDFSSPQLQLPAQFKFKDDALVKIPL